MIVQHYQKRPLKSPYAPWCIELCIDYCEGGYIYDLSIYHDDLFHGAYRSTDNFTKNAGGIVGHIAKKMIDFKRYRSIWVAWEGYDYSDVFRWVSGLFDELERV